MNRSILSLAALSAIACTSTASAFILNDTRHAGDDYSLDLTNIGADDNPDAGGPDKKDDAVTLAKGTLVGEGAEQTQQQAAAENAAAPGTAIDNKVDDVAALNTGEVKAAIGDPPAGQASQLG